MQAAPFCNFCKLSVDNIVFIITCIFQLEGAKNRVKLDLAVKDSLPQIGMCIIICCYLQ